MIFKSTCTTAQHQYKKTNIIGEKNPFLNNKQKELPKIEDKSISEAEIMISVSQKFP